jgi:4-hydroxy-tetrahydrodipicolinate synthase
MSEPVFEGVFSVLPTPFLPNGEIDRESLGRVIELYIEAGVNGLTALGVTSEVAKLSDQERSLVLETVMEKTSGRVPVVVGTSAGGLVTCIDYSKEAKSAGASAIMVSPPRMLKLSSEAVLKHYQSLSDAVGIPIVVQDYPPVSGFTMEPVLLARIAREVPKAHTIKLEDPPTPLKTARILQEGKGLPIKILGGLGGMYLLEELMAGASGAMTGFAYPEILVEIVRLYRSGQAEQAADTFYRFVALMRFEFQEGIGIAIRKEMLHRRGAISNPGIRPPGVALDSSTRDALDTLLDWVKTMESVFRT